MRNEKSAGRHLAQEIKPASGLSNKLSLVVLGGALLFMIVSRMHLLDIPLERDEGEYCYGGQQLLHGIPPFVSIYHVKFPGIYFAFAAVMKIFGQTTEGVHLGVLFLNLFTAITVYLIGKRLVSAMVGAMASLFFILFTLSQTLQGFSANAEHYVIFPAMLGILFLLRGFDTQPRLKSILNFAAAGLLLGLAYTMKQHAAFFILFAGVFFLFKYLYKNESLAGQSKVKIGAGLVLDGSVLVIGVLIPFGLTCALFWHLGLFEKFWWWTWNYPRTYVTAIPYDDAVKNFKWAFYPDANDGAVWAAHPDLVRKGIFNIFWPVLLFSAWGLVALIREKNLERIFFFVALLFFSLLAVSAGSNFYPHYFIHAAPVMAFLAAIGIQAIPADIKRVLNLKSGGMVEYAGIALMLLLFVIVISEEKDYLTDMDGTTIDRIQYGRSPFPEMPVIGKFINKNTLPDDRIVVMGSEPEVYFYADRRAATGFIYTYEMMRSHPFAHSFQTQMIQEIEQAKPKFIVSINIASSWFVSRGADMDTTIFGWQARYIQAHYAPAGVVSMPDWPNQRKGNFCWTTAETGCQPTSSMNVVLYRRMD